MSRRLLVALCLSTLTLAQPQPEEALLQLPADQRTLSLEYGQDLLAFFSWALDIKFTPAEQKRFILERQLEWVSGHNVWHPIYVGTYRTLLTLDDKMVAGNKAKQKELLLNFVEANTKQSATDILWIQKRLGDDEVNALPVSPARRTSLEKMTNNAAVATREEPGLLSGTFTRQFAAIQLGNALDDAQRMIRVHLTAEQREELADRAMKNWLKDSGLWSATNTSKTLFGYVANTANTIVYRDVTAHNLEQFRSFALRGDRDAKWLLDIYEKSYYRQPLLPAVPALTRELTRDYAGFVVECLNALYGKKVLAPDVGLTIQMQNDIAKGWNRFDPSKQAFILAGPTNLTAIRQSYAISVPLKQAHTRLLWGRELSKGMPELKPLVDAHEKLFADLAKKDPQWQDKMEEANNQAVQAYLARKQKEYDGVLANMKSLFDSMQFSQQMQSLQNTISRTPAGSTFHVTVRP